MNKIDMNGYGSHLPLMDMLFKAFQINKVIEFGCGKFSTAFFSELNVELISIEMQDEEWANKVKEDFNVEVILSLGALKFKEEIIDWECDLAFVDRHAESRPEAVNFMFGKAKVIVAHDYQKQKFYGWERINKPEDYHILVFAVGQRSSACFIHNSLLINSF